MSFSVLSYNTSFVTTYPSLIGFPASENAFIYDQLVTMYRNNPENAGKTPTPQEILMFLNQNFQELAKLSSQRIQGFFSQQSSEPVEYRVAALQEQNFNDSPLTNNLPPGVIVLMNYVVFGATRPALTYLFDKKSGNLFQKKDKIKETYFATDKIRVLTQTLATLKGTLQGKNQKETEEINNKIKLTETEIVAYNEILKRQAEFNQTYVAIGDLGVHELYRNKFMYKNVGRLPGTNDSNDPGADPLDDGGRPLSLIITSNSTNYQVNTKQVKNRRVFHFNAHVPNPSALRVFSAVDIEKRSTTKTKSINDEWELDQNETPMKQWASTSREVIETVANKLMTEFAGVTMDNNDVVILSGDLNDPSGYLMRELSENGITLQNKKVNFTFGETDNLFTCCANLNSNKVTGSKVHLGNMLVRGFSAIMGANPNYLTQPLETDYETGQWNNPANYKYKGDVTGVYIVSDSPPAPPTVTHTILPKPTTDALESSDHVPVVSTVTMSTRGGRRRRNTKKRTRRLKHRRYRSRRFF